MGTLSAGAEPVELCAPNADGVPFLVLGAGARRSQTTWGMPVQPADRGWAGAEQVLWERGSRGWDGPGLSLAGCTWAEKTVREWGHLKDLRD